MRPSLPLEVFLQAKGVLLDVRSPAEYAHACLPKSVSFPLFTDSERAEVGTLYKRQGRQEAITRGMELLAPRVEALCKHAASLISGDKVKVYCWRGGMRSQIIAGLLAIQGLESCTLQGGYKAYRKHCLETFSLCARLKLHVLGGMTGSRKTAILHALAEQGEQVLDLEDLARHRGSAFGGIGLAPQPSTEHFENCLAEQIHKLDLSRKVWIEDENRAIGTCALPKPLYEEMQKAPVTVFTRDVEERLDHLEDLYGDGGCDALTRATIKLKKRLGGERTQQICALLTAGETREAFRLLLNYYDRAYEHAVSRREEKQVYTISSVGRSVPEIVERLLNTT